MFYKYLLKENIFISFCSVFFFLSGFILTTGAYPDIPILSLIFWSTLLIYQINTKLKFNFLDLSSYKSLKHPFTKKIKIILAIGIILLFHLPFFNLATNLFLLHLGIISTLYNVPEKSKSFIHFPLRGVPVLKVFLIAYVWASMSSFLPAIIAHEQILTARTIYIFIAHFLFIISISLPFDIRDYAADNKNTLITFPQLIGIKLTKLLSLSCLIIFTLIIEDFTKGSYIYILSSLTGLLIINSSTQKKDFYYTFYLDGTIILYFLTIILSLE